MDETEARKQEMDELNKDVEELLNSRGHDKDAAADARTVLGEERVDDFLDEREEKLEDKDKKEEEDK